MEKLRLGHINFINCLPLAYGLNYGGYNNGIEVCEDVPASLNAAVVAGELDISPVSSIVYARHSDALVIVPGVSISADGALRSILLVSAKPIDQLDNEIVALTAKSETSHCLLKIILHDAYGVIPRYVITSQATAAQVLQDAAAVLLIGDDALFHYHNRQDGLYYYDVGAEWKALTGLPMVYALWVATGRLAQQPQLLQIGYERVTGGFHYGLDHLNQAIAALSSALPFDAGQLRDYLALLNWSWSSAHQQALLAFYQRACTLDLIDAVPALMFAEVRQ